MFKLVLLFLALSGLQAAPIAAPRGLQRASSYQLPGGFRQGTEHLDILEAIPDDYRQGTEPSRRFLVDLNTGRVQERISEMDRRTGLQAAPIAAPRGLQRASSYQLPNGFRQGTEHLDILEAIPDDFRQGTEPSRRFLVDLNTGRVQERISEMDRRTGLQAAPIAAPRGLQRASSYQLPNGFRQGTEHFDILEAVPDDYRQGTEPSRRFLVDLNTGRVQERISEMDRRTGFIQPSLGNGHGEMDRRHWLKDEVPVDVPAQRNGGGWVRVEVPSVPHLPDGFRQGTEPFRSIPDGFRQGTEPFRSIPDGFRQGTEPFRSIPDGFRQGTEPFRSIPDGFRQGTEPFRSIPDGFRQGTELSTSRLQTKTVACKGEVINGNCFEFNPTPLAFQEAQASCRALGSNADLASVTSGDLHSRLVSLVTNGGVRSPPLTWLGGTVKNQQASWVDGSEWSYSDWMPGHPNIHTDKPVCVEMFKTDGSWWSAADCELKRASICSYPITA